MAAKIDYFFTCISPFSYLGHQAIQEVARRQGVQLSCRPMRLGEVFATSGAVPLAQRTEARKRYRLVELQRIAEFRGLPINLKPAFFPADPSLGDATVASLAATGADPLDYMDALYRAVWVDDANVADEGVVAARLTECGHDAAAIIAAARSEAMQEAIVRNTADAVAAGAMGSPTYVLNGEPFWGQDRIEYLDRALSIRRAPFHP